MVEAEEALVIIFTFVLRAFEGLLLAFREAIKLFHEVFTFLCNIIAALFYLTNICILMPLVSPLHLHRILKRAT